MNTLKGLKDLFSLSLPIIMGQVGQMLIGAGDVYIASLYSTKLVAAAGVANGIINPLFLFGIGLMFGISPCLSIKRGKGIAKRGLTTTMISFSSIAGIVITFCTLVLNQFIPYIGLEEELIPIIQEYNNIVCFSFPFALIYQALREYLQGFEEVFFSNFLAIFAVFFNLGLNYILVFGIGPMEGMGNVGLALASVGTRFLMALALFIYVLKRESLQKINWSLCKEVFVFGLPIAGAFFFEVLAFCLVGVLSGKISILAAATNNIILTMSALTFMVPMSISSAVSVKVGHSLGKKSIEGIKYYANASFLLVIFYIMITTTLYFSIPEYLMSITTKDYAVIALGVKLLFFVAIFQIVDCFQVVFAGILRGLEYMNEASVVIFIGYWLTGIPTGIYLTFYLNMGLQGLWIGLTISLTLVAISLGGLYFYKLGKFKKSWS